MDHTEAEDYLARVMGGQFPSREARPASKRDFSGGQPWQWEAGFESLAHDRLPYRR